jgi:hypothetical protein
MRHRETKSLFHEWSMVTLITRLEMGARKQTNIAETPVVGCLGGKVFLRASRGKA